MPKFIEISDLRNIKHLINAKYITQIKNLDLSVSDIVGTQISLIDGTVIVTDELYYDVYKRFSSLYSCSTINNK